MLNNNIISFVYEQSIEAVRHDYKRTNVITKYGFYTKSKMCNPVQIMWLFMDLEYYILYNNFKKKRVMDRYI